ncbi:putative glucan endo-1,3-beta-glucosidase btgC [Hypsizygus marmoreus]|uniref:glucan endo-1,3-beta-D-glucosidase n=1 Tax=Hypsizygus marmoreus TaxID=39966 RepID=A0A369JFQ6_HYPMA|nr:putative glucan endo-1,3-beta-glucosidase btgC [Hypsizygus marmoreus]
MGDNYHTLDQYSSEKNAARQRRSKWIVIGSILVLVVLIGAGVAAGIIISNRNKSNGGSSSSSKGNNKDPSVFTKDPRLHKSFYGLAYTPEGSLVPECGNSLENVIKDIQLMSQLTTRVRLYGADCNQTALVLEAIKQTKVDIQVFLGNYVVPTDHAAYERQRDILKDAIQTYGTDHIAGVTVGNEFMLNYLTEHEATDPDGEIGKQGAAILLADIQDTRDMLASLALPKDIPVGNSDAGSFFSTDVLSAVDYGLSNVHAWFANTTAEGAAEWVTTFFEETNVQPAALLPNKPKMYIAETGWPTKSSDAGNANNGGSDASVAGLQAFMDNFVCQANDNGIPYFFFEFFDEEWKDIQFGGVEGWWGLFNADRTLKDITIPNCTAP